jgi:hypothetical protein
MSPSWIKELDWVMLLCCNSAVDNDIFIESEKWCSAKVVKLPSQEINCFAVKNHVSS